MHLTMNKVSTNCSINWINKSSLQQLSIKICYLKSFSLHLKCKLNNSQHISSDDTYMWIMNSLVLWNKMLTTKLHIFLSFEKYLIIIRTPFLNDYWHWSKWREGGWSYPKGRSNSETGVMVEEKGVKKFLFDWSDFFLRLMYVFYINRLFILAIHLMFPQTILRLEIKMPDCADSQWYDWLKKMNIESTQYVCHEFQKRRGCRSPCKGGYQEGGMIPLFKYAGVESGFCNQMRQIVSF